MTDRRRWSRDAGGRTRRSRVLALVGLFFVLAGAGFIILSSFARNGPRSQRLDFEPIGMPAFGWLMAGSIFVMLGLATRLVARRQRLFVVLLGLTAVATTLSVVRELAPGDTVVAVKVASAVILVLFFVAPFPVLLFLYGRSQDELQRSLALGAAAVAFFVTLLAVLAHWMLDRLVGVPELSSLWPVWFGLVAWGFAWVLLRIRVI